MFVLLQVGGIQGGATHQPQHPDQSWAGVLDSREDRAVPSRPDIIDNTCGCVCGVPNRGKRIVGGQVTKANEFPWLVALYLHQKFFCAGSLVTRRHILTAAHCLENVDAKEVRAVLGEHDRSSPAEAATWRRRVKWAASHPAFDAHSFSNDVAVLELEVPVHLGDSVRTACLPRRGGEEHAGRVAVVAGWGKTSEQSTTSLLPRKVSVPVLSRRQCALTHYSPHSITDSVICAGYLRGRKDSCVGDSGGPLHVDGGSGSLQVIGIVSWGRGCARPYLPGVYTRVSSFLGWIGRHLRGECLCPPLAVARNSVRCSEVARNSTLF